MFLEAGARLRALHSPCACGAARSVRSGNLQRGHARHGAQPLARSAAGAGRAAVQAGLACGLDVVAKHHTQDSGPPKRHFVTAPTLKSQPAARPLHRVFQRLQRLHPIKQKPLSRTSHEEPKSFVAGPAGCCRQQGQQQTTWVLHGRSLEEGFAWIRCRRCGALEVTVHGARCWQDSKVGPVTERRLQGFESCV